jgi:hypothetical protein
LNPVPATPAAGTGSLEIGVISPEITVSAVLKVNGVIRSTYVKGEGVRGLKSSNLAALAVVTDLLSRKQRHGSRCSSAAS